MKLSLSDLGIISSTSWAYSSSKIATLSAVLTLLYHWSYRFLDPNRSFLIFIDYPWLLVLRLPFPLPAHGSRRFQTFSTSWKWKSACQFSSLKWGGFTSVKFTVADWLCLRIVPFFHHCLLWVNLSTYIIAYNKSKYLSPEGLWVVNGGW